MRTHINNIGRLRRLWVLLPVVAAALLVIQPAMAQVAFDDLETRDGLMYEPNASEPYSGAVEVDGRSTGEVRDGLREGTWTWYHANGQRSQEVQFAAGVRLLTRSWSESGQQVFEVSFLDGRSHGTMREWNEEGVLVEIRELSSGQLHGPRRIYLSDGALLYEATYEAGQLHGAATWFYADGQPRWTTEYESGVRVGTWTQFAPDGEVQMQSVWDSGELTQRINPHAGH